MTIRSTGFLLLVAGFGGTLFDFGGTVIAPAIPYLEELGAFTTAEISRLTSAVVWSAAVSCFLTGFLADRIGRKPTMALAGCLALAAMFLICLSGGAFGPFYAGRLLQGLAAGMIGVVVPMYFVEVLPTASRGKGAAVFQLLDIGGILLCSLVGIAVVRFLGAADDAAVSVAAKTRAWQVIFASNAGPSALFLLGTLFLPESPVFLNRRTHRVAPTAQDSQALIQREHVVPFLLAVVVLMCNQGTAVTSLQYYAVKLFQDAGLPNTLANTLNGVTMALFFGATALALPLVDRVGRRPLMLVGTAGIVVCHLIASAVFFAISRGVLGLGTGTGFAVSAAIAGVVFFFGMGPGVVAWLFLSELMPNRIRAVGMSVAMFFNMVVAYLIADRMLVVGERFGHGPMFAIFAFSTVIYFLVTLFLLPETKGRSFEEIERSFCHE